MVATRARARRPGCAGIAGAADPGGGRADDGGAAAPASALASARRPSRRDRTEQGDCREAASCRRCQRRRSAASGSGRSRRSSCRASTRTAVGPSRPAHSGSIPARRSRRSPPVWIAPPKTSTNSSRFSTGSATRRRASMLRTRGARCARRASASAARSCVASEHASSAPGGAARSRVDAPSSSRSRRRAVGAAVGGHPQAQALASAAPSSTARPSSAAGSAKSSSTARGRSAPSARPRCRSATTRPSSIDRDPVGEQVGLLEVLRGQQQVAPPPASSRPRPDVAPAAASRPVVGRRARRPAARSQARPGGSRFDAAGTCRRGDRRLAEPERRSAAPAAAHRGPPQVASARDHRRGSECGGASSTAATAGELSARRT